MRPCSITHAGEGTDAGGCALLQPPAWLDPFQQRLCQTGPQPHVACGFQGTGLGCPTLGVSPRFHQSPMHCWKPSRFLGIALDYVQSRGCADAFCCCSPDVYAVAVIAVGGGKALLSKVCTSPRGDAPWASDPAACAVAVLPDCLEGHLCAFGESVHQAASCKCQDRIR